jgi:hypothetical protein
MLDGEQNAADKLGRYLQLRTKKVAGSFDPAE